MQKINLENILIKMFENGQPFYNQKDIKNAMLQFGKQLLELAAENSKIEIKTIGEELIIADVHQEDIYTRIQVNIPSILDTIKQVE